MVSKRLVLLPLLGRLGSCASAGHPQGLFSGPQAVIQKNMASSGSVDTEKQSFETLRIKNTEIAEAPGVSLSPRQRLLVGSVLDLFEGRPTLGKLALWERDATFKDPLTIATGFDRFAAQWYGLPALFGPIAIQSSQVTSAGDPIELRLSNRYTVRGIGAEKVIDSVVRVRVGEDGRIRELEDRWNDKLPEGAISEAFRKLNAVTVPAFVTVPKTEEEDRKMERSREGTGNKESKA